MNVNPAIRKRSFLWSFRREKSSEADILKQKKPRALRTGSFIFYLPILFTKAVLFIVYIICCRGVGRRGIFRQRCMPARSGGSNLVE